MEQAFLILGGTWLILYGTELYWPMERFRDWQASSPFFMMFPGFKIQHQIMLAIRNDEHLRRAYRGAFGAGQVFVGAAGTS
jgi:hypothetical protein